MATLISSPTIVPSAGTLPKKIAEFFGRVNSQTESLSIARMTSPAGWEEPGQTPEFDEYSIVLSGVLRVQTQSGVFDVTEDQAVKVNAGEWVKYSTPHHKTEYVAICVPAFSMDTVHRDE